MTLTRVLVRNVFIRAVDVDKEYLLKEEVYKYMQSDGKGDEETEEMSTITLISQFPTSYRKAVFEEVNIANAETERELKIRKFIYNRKKNGRIK